ncbi:unnamed protein product [Moneuplotes crassus]|uniref:BTB domain-containing protein n=1 Tax=Euplotes crassus TaxID=5936 RepID=A0AAD1XT01_EUPCR|nr:unnamed protein product [Moneuplotes crassus]
MTSESLYWHDMRIHSHFQKYPSPRWAHTCVNAEDIMYIIGGFDGEYLNEIWKFNFEARTLKMIDTHIDQSLKRSNQTSVYFSKDKCIYLFGGGGPDKQRCNDTHKFNIKTEQMVKVHTFGKPPLPRTYHTANIIESYMIVIGGEAEFDMNDVHLLDLENNCWVKLKLKNNGFSPRRFHTSTICEFKNNLALSQKWRYKIYMFGGCHQDYEYLSDIIELDFEDAILDYKLTQKPFLDKLCKECSQLPQIPGLNNLSQNVREGQSESDYKENLSISQKLENCKNEIKQAIITCQHRLPTISWKKFKNKSVRPPPRWGHSAAEYDGKIYIFGGRNETDCNDLYCFDVLTKKWTDLYNQDSLLPKARRRHSAIFVGRTMVLFGGYDGVYLSDMYYINAKPFSIIYDPKDIHKVYLSLINKPEFADVCFIATNESERYHERGKEHTKRSSLRGSLLFPTKTYTCKIYAHSVLLVYRLMNKAPPDFIRKVIDQKKTRKVAIVHLPDQVTFRSFLKILEFLYCGTFINKISLRDLTDIIKACDALQFECLQKYIHSAIQKHDLICSQNQNSSSISSDYSLREPNSENFTFSSDTFSQSDNTEELSWNSAPLVEKQDGTSIHGEHLLSHDEDLEMYGSDANSKDLSIILLKYGENQSTMFDFYKLMNKEVVSPEDIEEEDSSKFFKDLIFNKSLCSNFGDIVILVGDQYYQSYKCILVERSEYFRIMLTNFKESGQAYIHLNSIKVKYFDTIYEYLITGKTMMKHKSCSSLVKLMILAKYFMIEELVAQCVIHIRQYLSDFTVYHLYLIGESYNIASLTEMCLDYLSFKTREDEEISKQYKRFKEICSPSLLQEFEKAMKQVKKNNIVMSCDHYITHGNINPITFDSPSKYKKGLDSLLSLNMITTENDFPEIPSKPPSPHSKTVRDLLSQCHTSFASDTEDFDSFLEPLSLPKSQQSRPFTKIFSEITHENPHNFTISNPEMPFENDHDSDDSSTMSS